MELKNEEAPFAKYSCVLYTKLVRNRNFERQSFNVIFSVWLDFVRERDFSDSPWGAFVGS